MKTRWQLTAAATVMCLGVVLGARRSDAFESPQADTPVPPDVVSPSAPLVCHGCLILLPSNPSKTGTSCGNSISIRIVFDTDIHGDCTTDPANCMTQNQCIFEWHLDYISANCDVTLSGSDCQGTISTGGPATSVWTTIASRAWSLNCGDFCDPQYGISCGSGCSIIRFTPNFGCSDCSTIP